MSFSRLLFCYRKLILPKFGANCAELSAKNNGLKSWQRSVRCVHSSNKHEIDFLFSKYKLSKISNARREGYGQKSALHHFNVINDFNFETESDNAVEALKQLLDIRKSEATALVNQFPTLLEISSDKLKKQILYLSEHFGLSADDFTSCPWTLFLPTNFTTERLNPFDSRNVNKNHLVLLLLPLKTYESVSRKIKNKKYRNNIFEDFNQKLKLFTESLDMIGEEFCDLVHENSFLFHYDFERIRDIMDLILRAGVRPEIILSDIRLFTHNINVMKERVDECLKHNMPIKTWMLRSAEYEFRVALRRHTENKKHLKDYENNKEYMANQLMCDKNVIESMTKRYPRIVQISAKNLSEKLSLLLKKGFTSYHIVDTPKILFHSIDTIVKRIRELESIDIRPNSLKILTLSEKDYQKLLEQLRENNGRISD